MAQFIVEKKDGSTRTVEAERIIVEWPGVRLEGAEGEIIAVWLDGSVSSVVPSTAVVTPPPVVPEP